MILALLAFALSLFPLALLFVGLGRPGLGRDAESLGASRLDSLALARETVDLGRDLVALGLQLGEDVVGTRDHECFEFLIALVRHGRDLVLLGLDSARELVEIDLPGRDLPVKIGQRGFEGSPGIGLDLVAGRHAILGFSVGPRRERVVEFHINTPVLVESRRLINWSTLPESTALNVHDDDFLKRPLENDPGGHELGVALRAEAEGLIAAADGLHVGPVGRTQRVLAESFGVGVNHAPSELAFDLATEVDSLSGHDGIVDIEDRFELRRNRLGGRGGRIGWLGSSDQLQEPGLGTNDRPAHDLFEGVEVAGLRKIGNDFVSPLVAVRTQTDGDVVSDHAAHPVFVLERHEPAAVIAPVAHVAIDLVVPVIDESAGQEVPDKGRDGFNENGESYEGHLTRHVHFIRAARADGRGGRVILLDHPEEGRGEIRVIVELSRLENTEVEHEAGILGHERLADRALDHLRPQLVRLPLQASADLALAVGIDVVLTVVVALGHATTVAIVNAGNRLAVIGVTHDKPHFCWTP